MRPLAYSTKCSCKCSCALGKSTANQMGILNLLYRHTTIMRIGNWIRLTWWQKTRAAALAFSMLATICLFLLTILLAGLSNTTLVNSLSWLAFSMFPLLIVVLIATLVRVQSQINLRSGTPQVTPPNISNGSKK